MRTSRQRNPSKSTLTPEQEARHIVLEQIIESFLMRARILTRGAAFVLNQTDEYTNDNELREIHRCIGEAIEYNTEAHKNREQLRQIELENESEEPAKPQ